MTTTQPVTKQSHPELVALMHRVYPNYRGRKFRVRVTDRMRIHDYWDGGSRTYARFLHLPTGQVVSSDTIPMDMRQKQGNGFNLPIAEGMMVPDVALVEHSIFCGKDAGLTLVLHPDNAMKMLPASTEAR